MAQAVARLHRELMQALLAEIAHGDFRDGDTLRSVSELSAQFLASRGVVREALRGLEERSVVHVRQGRGALVRPRRDWNVLDADVLSVMLETAESPAVLAELLECRRILEIEAAGLAAERAVLDDLNMLADAFARMTSLADRTRWNRKSDDRFLEADVAFHNGIFRASGNRMLTHIVEPIQRALFAARRPLARPDVRLEQSIPEHKAILAAIADRNPGDARERMRYHLATVAGYLAEYTEHFAEPGDRELLADSRHESILRGSGGEGGVGGSSR